ncbi:MAG: hypothetical protein AAGL10_14995 [Pseudomonadota bacterium]
MLKIHRLMSLIAAGLLTLGLSSNANAQDRPRGHVLIVNDSDEERRVCLYNKRLNMTFLPNRCYTLPVGYSIVWERRGRLREFRVEVRRTQDGLDPVILAKDDVSADTSQIIVRDGNISLRSFGEADWVPRAPAEYRVKFCNVSYSTKVWLTIGMEAGFLEMTEGYWAIEPDECVTVNYSARAGKKLRVPPKSYPIVPYFRAYTTGENSVRWSGQEANGDPLYCVNSQSTFALEQWRLINGRRIEYPCDREGEELQRFRPAPALDRDTPIARVDF